MTSWRIYLISLNLDSSVWPPVVHINKLSMGWSKHKHCLIENPICFNGEILCIPYILTYKTHLFLGPLESNRCIRCTKISKLSAILLHNPKIHHHHSLHWTSVISVHMWWGSIESLAVFTHHVTTSNDGHFRFPGAVRSLP